MIITSSKSLQGVHDQLLLHRRIIMGRIFKILFILIIFGMASCSSSLNRGQVSPNFSSQQGILYRRHGLQSGQMQRDLVVLDLSGNESVLIEGLDIDHRQIYISPDATMVSFRDGEGDLYISDMVGEITEHTFPANEDKWEEWCVWGWADFNHLIISQNVGGQITFYEMDTTVPELTLTPVNRLNDFFDQYVDESYLPDGEIPYRWLYFDSSFTYVVTPLHPRETLHPSVQDRLFFLDLSTSISEPLGSVDRIFPWWELPLYHPAWSFSSGLVAQALFDNMGCPVDLYLYNAQNNELTLLDEFDCGEGIPPYPAYLQWNTEETQLAYWELSNQVSSSQLVIINLDELERHVLLDNENPGPLFWSQNDALLALERNATINIIEVETGSIIELANMGNVDQFVDLIGWVNLP